MELCLGTVQFGMNYGILNQSKPLRSDAVKWMDYATKNGIYAIDTARAYGTAEEVVGDFLSRKTIQRDKLFISTKLRPNILDDVKPSDYETVIENEVTSQLKTLNTDYVDAYVFHSARYAHDIDKLQAIRSVVEKGYAKKSGVSIYEPIEAMACIKSGIVDFIQLPYSIFDHRMRKSDIFENAERSGIEVHSRSAFLQGLIGMEEYQVPEFLEKAKPIVKRIAHLCKAEGINPVHLAMQYVKREKRISHLVFGVDSLEQLKEDIDFFREDLSKDVIDHIGKEFDGIEADIIMPSLWKK